MNVLAAKKAFQSNAVHTASPTRIVVMLAERLTSDAAQAAAAIEEKRISDAHDLLIHAQQIVDVLSDALDIEACPAGSTLLALYDYLSHELTEANIKKDVSHAENARQIASEIAATFREAEASK